ncbi:MAG: hypothetical protein AAF591_18165 [Verrucomicrobiota bacterium]
MSESGDVSFLKRPWWVVGVLAVIGGVLRWPGLFTELWLDEIWSVDLAAEAGSWVEVLTEIRISNNHPLNTWWLMLWDGRGSEMWWRLPSWVAGVATIPAVYWVVRRGGGGVWAGVTGALLVTVSFFQVVYGSEARGYAVCLLCVVICLGALWGRPEAPGWGMVVLYWVAAVVGALANAGFLVFWGALVVWHSGVVIWGARTWDVVVRRAGVLGVMHGSVGVLFVLYWWFVVRNLEWQGAGHVRYEGALERAAEWMFNLGWMPWGLGVAVGMVLVSMWWFWWRGRGEVTLFLILSIFVMPWLAFQISPPKTTGFAHLVILLPQYFFIPGSLALLATGWVMGDVVCFARRGGVRAIGAIVVVVIVVGVIPLLSTFYRFGRGGIGEAVRAMAEQSSSEGEVLVGFNTPGRMPKEFLFHVRRLLGDDGERFRHTDQADWDEAPPEWVLGLVTGDYPDKLRRFEARNGPEGDVVLRYELVEGYPYGEATGYHCMLFRRAEEGEGE